MKTRYKVIMAVAAFLLTFLFITFFNTCIANAKEKEKTQKEKTEASSGLVKTSEKSFYKVIQRIARKNATFFRKMFEIWIKQIEKEKQLREDIELLAEVIYWENWHTDKEHLAAYYTGAVVMNRVKGKNWPNTVHDVVYEKGQYAVVPYLFTVEIPQECYQMAEDILRNGTPDVPENVVYQATFVQGSGDWIPPINGEHFCYG